jgi:hypothetical protein
MEAATDNAEDGSDSRYEEEEDDDEWLVSSSYVFSLFGALMPKWVKSLSTYLGLACKTLSMLSPSCGHGF